MTGHETENDIKELEILKETLAKDPKNVSLLLKIAMFLCEPFHDIDSALPYFTAAMKYHPSNVDAIFWTSYFMYHEMFAYEESKKLFLRAIALDPSRAESYYMMFYVLWHMTHNADTGLKYLLKAIELEPYWFSPREQYITYFIMNNKFNEAEHELADAYIALEKGYKNKKENAINILEKYEIDCSKKDMEYIYHDNKRILDGMKKRIEEKRKTFNTTAK